MRNHDHDRAGARSTFMGSVKGLATTIAVGAAFFITPVIYSSTVSWVQRFAATHYGYGWDDLVSIGWFLITACTVFFVARASISTVLVMGGLALATRFL